MIKLLFTLLLIAFAAPALFAQAGDTLWITPFSFFGAKITAVKFSPDDKYIFAATPEGVEKLDAEAGYFVSRFNSQNNIPFHNAKFASNSSKVILYNENDISVCDIAKEKWLWGDRIDSMLKVKNAQFKEISPDGKYGYFSIKNVDKDGIIVYNFDERRIEKKLDGYGDILEIADSPDGRYLSYSSGYYSKSIYLLDTISMKYAESIDHYEGTDHNAKSLKFSSDGSKLYFQSGLTATGYHGTVYNVAGKSKLNIFDMVQSTVGQGTIFNRDNSFIISNISISEWDSVANYAPYIPNVLLYSTFDGKLKKSYKRHAGSAFDVSHDDSKLAVGNDKQLVMLAPRFSEILSVESRDASANPKPYIFQLAGNKLSITPIADNLPGRAEIANIFGQTILTQDLSQTHGTVNIDISGFTAGVYFIRIGSQVEKFVKM